MLRAALLFALLASACRHDPAPIQPRAGDLPPLPSSSGTPIGYLIDAATQLQLRDDQLAQLKQIDAVLAPKDDDIETQLRLIEKPEADPPAAKGAPPPRHNNAPGAQVKTTPDATRLRNQRREQDAEALQRAFALLDPAQQDGARRVLEDRGIQPPGNIKPASREPTGDAPSEK